MTEKLTRIGFLILMTLMGWLSPVGAQASDRSLLKELGVKEGESYASGKSKLLKAGWKIDITHAKEVNGRKPSPYGFDEVVCGNGWDASCSARFIREGREIMFIMRPKKTLIIDGASDDK